MFGIRNVVSYIGQLVRGGTTGSVLFVGASGEIQQDNANLFWDDTANRLGIGTLGPTSHKLDIVASADNNDVVYVKNAAGNAIITLRSSSGGIGVIQVKDSTGTITGKMDGTGVVVGATGNVASAILQADSTTKGLLPPRMTTTQKNAVSSPATGLVIFDTSLAKLCVYTGAAWETVTSI